MRGWDEHEDGDGGHCAEIKQHIICDENSAIAFVCDDFICIPQGAEAVGTQLLWLQKSESTWRIRRGRER